VGESEDLGQSTHNNDLASAALLARMDFNPIDERTNGVHCLWARLLIVEHLSGPAF
jgi:hypothetical protein